MSDDEMQKQEWVTAEPLLPCPHCGAMIGLLPEHDGLVHEGVMCEKFDAMEPSDFLKWMNEYYEQAVQNEA